VLRCVLDNLMRLVRGPVHAETTYADNSDYPCLNAVPLASPWRSGALAAQRDSFKMLMHDKDRDSRCLPLPNSTAYRDAAAQLWHVAGSIARQPGCGRWMVVSGQRLWPSKASPACAGNLAARSISTSLSSRQLNTKLRGHWSTAAPNPLRSLAPGLQVRAAQWRHWCRNLECDVDWRPTAIAANRTLMKGARLVSKSLSASDRNRGKSPVQVTHGGQDPHQTPQREPAWILAISLGRNQEKTENERKTKAYGQEKEGFFPSLWDAQPRDTRANGASTGPQRTFRTA